MFAVVLSGCLLGLASAPHCAAMCGPLAALACARSPAARAPWRYQLGRTLSYAMAGALSGHLGRAVQALAPGLFGGWLFASFAAGSCALLAARVAAERQPAEPLVTLGTSGRRPLFGLLARLVPRDPVALGALTVFLPCGALAVALLAAASAASAPLGAASMVAFATCSAPGVLGLGAAARLLPRVAAPRLRRSAGLLLAAAACVLLARPLVALGGAPSAGAQPTHAARCH